MHGDYATFAPDSSSQMSLVVSQFESTPASGAFADSAIIASAAWYAFERHVLHRAAVPGVKVRVGREEGLHRHECREVALIQARIFAVGNLAWSA